MFKKFKEFAFKSNVMDLAVAVIIGAAFGKIITSLVNDLLMPLIGILLGGVSFTNLKYVITPAIGDVAEVAVRYGAFIQSVVDFMIIAVSIFVVINILASVKKKKPVVVVPPAGPSKEELLLTEIRDILKTKKV